MPFGSTFFSQIRLQNALTEIAWEDAEQVLGMAMSTVASEKNGELLFIGNVFINSDIPGRCFTSVSRARAHLKIANFNPQQEARSVSLGLGHN